MLNLERLIEINNEISDELDALATDVIFFYGVNVVGSDKLTTRGVFVDVAKHLLSPESRRLIFGPDQPKNRKRI